MSHLNQAQLFKNDFHYYNRYIVVGTSTSLNIKFSWYIHTLVNGTDHFLPDIPSMH